MAIQVFQEVSANDFDVLIGPTTHNFNSPWTIHELFLWRLPCPACALTVGLVRGGIQVDFVVIPAVTPLGFLVWPSQSIPHSLTFDGGTKIRVITNGAAAGGKCGIIAYWS